MLQLFYPSATSRKGHDIETMTDVESSAQCATMCNQHQRCLAWSYEKNNCSLKETMPLHAYSPDVTSGKSEKQAISKMPLYSFVCHRLATCQRSGFRNLGDFLLVESAILGFEIRETAQGIRNPSSTDKESGIHSVESRIQNCPKRFA